MSSTQPQPRYRHAAFGVGLKQYVWAGSADINTAQIETFDISSAKWEKPQLLQGSLPDSLSGMAVTTDGEHAYTFGGVKGSTRINTLYEINPRTLQCRELLPESSLHAPKGASASGLVYYKGKLVVYGGYTDEGRTDDLHVFDLRKSECIGGEHAFTHAVFCHYKPANIES